MQSGCEQEPKKGPLVLRAADNQPKDYPTVVGLEYMGGLIKERTNGRIEVKVFSGGQFGNETMTIEATQMGTLDINRVSVAPLTSFSKKIGVFAMPYIFRDEAHFWNVLDGGIGGEVGRAIEPKGLKALAYYDSGARSFYNTKRPIRSPADLAGLKIRTQESRIMIDMVNTLGAAGAPMSYGEVYTSLQTGVIDGAENNPPSYSTSNHFEVAKYYSLDEHARVPEVVLISMKTWNRLSPEDRRIVAGAAKDSEIVQRILWKIKELAEWGKVIAAGSQINTPARKPFAEKVKPMYDAYNKDYGGLVERIRAVK